MRPPLPPAWAKEKSHLEWDWGSLPPQPWPGECSENIQHDICMTNLCEFVKTGLLINLCDFYLNIYVRSSVLCVVMYGAMYRFMWKARRVKISQKFFCRCRKVYRWCCAVIPAVSTCFSGLTLLSHSSLNSPGKQTLNCSSTLYMYIQLNSACTCCIMYMYVETGLFLRVGE